MGFGVTQRRERRSLIDMAEDPADAMTRWVTESDWLNVGRAAERELRAILTRKQAWRERLREQRREDRAKSGEA